MGQPCTWIYMRSASCRPPGWKVLRSNFSLSFLTQVPSRIFHRNPLKPIRKCLWTSICCPSFRPALPAYPATLLLNMERCTIYSIKRLTLSSSPSKSGTNSAEMAKTACCKWFRYFDEGLLMSITASRNTNGLCLLKRFNNRFIITVPVVVVSRNNDK